MIFKFFLIVCFCGVVLEVKIAVLFLMWGIGYYRVLGGGVMRFRLCLGEIIVLIFGGSGGGRGIVGGKGDGV